MGFGGINTHLVLEGVSSKRRTVLTRREHSLLSSAQDAELILFSGQDAGDVQQQVAHLLPIASRLSLAEITDLALHLTRTLQRGPLRAAVVASSPIELTRRLERLKALLASGVTTSIDPHGGVYIGQSSTPPRIGFLFPGQSSPVYLQGGLLRRRFAFVDDLYKKANLPVASDGKDTKVAQPAIVAASLAALGVLHELGITACLGIGHSLGELTALHWAGAFDAETLLRLATVRGDAMSTLGSPTGTMVSIMAPKEVVEELIDGEDALIAGINAPHQTVVSGDAAAIASVVVRAQSKQLHVSYLKVSHAFHSPLVAAAVQPFAEHLADEAFQPLQRAVISTVTGSPIEPDEDLKALLCEQITSPVQFVGAVNQASAETDLLIEVGPGKILSGLAAECVCVPAIALDAGGASLKGLLHAAGAAFALGVPLKHDLLSANRFSRPFDLNWQPRFFANPCEQAPLSDLEVIFSREQEEALSPQDTMPAPENVALPSKTDTSSIIDLIRQLVADRAELPAEAVSDSSRMLGDLHLNSITVGQIVSEAARVLGILPPVAPTEYADASVAEIAQALEELKESGGAIELEERMRTPSGVDSWIRAFQVEYVEKPLARGQSRLSGQCGWKVLAPAEYPFTEKLKKACALLEGEGVIVCLPPHPEEQHLPFLLQGVREVLSEERACHFVLVQHGGGGAGIARTLALEIPKQTVCVVDVPPEHPQTVDWVLAEIQAASGYSEAVYDVHGKRSIPRLQLLPLSAETYAPLSIGPDDVLLVTGGGKGIAAECALSLARKTGIRLALLGRSQASDDSALAENLSRFAASGINFRYISTDVTDAEAVRQAVCEIEMNLGPVTALLHGAGTNTPKLISVLKEADMFHTLAPKVQGLKHVLSAIDPERIRLLVTFGSVIARTGMRGEADYALANDWLARLTEEFQAEHPTCRCLCLEWSVWSSIGMGERLGRIDALMREGIMPIPLDKGVACFHRLLNHHLPHVRLVVASRLGTSPVLQLATPDLPFLRFLEQPRIYYPGIELVTDVELSTTTDLYLEDHKFRGERLLPAVVGLEAMAQVAMAVTARDHRPHFENVQLERPIVVPEKAPLKIRIAALVQESGKVDVVLRSEETAFQVDHFRATCHFNDQPLEKREYPLHLAEPMVEQSGRIDLDPVHDLYGSILFHRGHFQRVRRYYHLRATECIAEIAPHAGEGIFAHYLPSELVLGDFTSRDAVIHCIQACIPHARLLPIAVEEIRFAPGHLHPEQTRFVYARERFRLGDVFIYDVEVRTAHGDIEEQWRGLQLRQIETLQPGAPWKEALLGPYIEWKLSEFFPEASIELVIQNYPALERQTRSDQAFHSLLGSAVAVQRRPNGKPAVMEKYAPILSASHHGHLTLATISSQPIGCDLESVTSQSTLQWQNLLGAERYRLASFIASQAGEELHTSAARIWAASECLRKVSAMVNTPLTFWTMKEDGWVLLRTGSFVVATYITSLHDREERVVFAICSGVEPSMEAEQAIKR
jgi:enediyne polyketide synthase